MTPLFLIALLSVQADTADRLRGAKAPVEMTAQGGLRIDLDKRIGIATGDVLITRADVQVCCDKATARYSGDRVESVECRGRVVVVRADGTRAKADVAFFDAGKDRITLTGHAQLRSAAADLSGDEIVYLITADKLNVRGKKSRFRFSPKAQPALDLGRKCPP